MSFSGFRDPTSSLYKKYKILKFNDYVTMQNCLLIHDFLNNKLPISFENYFNTTDDLYSFKIKTRGSVAGCLFIPYASSTKYGLNSIKRKAIMSWNYLVRNFNNINLFKLSRNQLKNYITEYYINLY